MVLELILGKWLYWPLVVIAVCIACTVAFNSVSTCYTELLAQIAELKRVSKKDNDANHN